MKLDVRFVTSNPHKIEEAQSILSRTGVRVVALPQKLEELQTEDTTALVKNKTLKAFEIVGRPLFVEHTGLSRSWGAPCLLNIPVSICVT